MPAMPTDPAPASPNTATSSVGTALGPLRRPLFRMLWATWAVANTCMWMNDVASAWLMTQLSNSTVMVALVQTASTLPVFLLGLPSGALADILPRRNWLMATQLWVAFNAVILSAVMFADAMNPGLLLLLTFGNGIGLALRWPVYSAIIAEVVPREELAPALALNGVAMNLARIVGPIVAGALLASVGGAYVFALNAVLSIAAALLLLTWKPESQVKTLPGERFVGAMRVGWQYVRQSAPMRAVLLRIATFFLQSTALLALLPVVALRVPGGGSAGTFTLLLSSMGAGAIAAVLWLPRLRVTMSRDRLVRDGSLVQAVAMLGVAFAPNAWVAAALMLFAGASWITVANTLAVSAQVVLPDWVRARGMSMYQIALMGGAALGAALWGQVAQWTDLQTSLTAAAITGSLILLLTSRWSIGHEGDVDLTPARILTEPTSAFTIEHEKGPVMVTVEYEVDPARAQEFFALMQESRVNRLQKGALSWGLFHDTSDPKRYLEYYLDESWAEHLRRFDRFTAADMDLRDRRNAFHVGEQPPKISRYVAEDMAR
jgi:MFS family permease